MKSIHTIILSILIANFVAAQEKVNLKFNFYFANSNEGSIRKTKLVVKSDGVKIGESTVKDQDKYNSVEVNIPKGYHRITAVACAQNDGIWEERTLANNYSLDCIYEKSQNWNAGYIIDLRFDLKDMDVKADEEILFGDDMLDNLTNNNTASSTNTNSTTDYQTALKKLNDYLKTFDNGYYGYLEIKDGYLYDRFKNGNDYCRGKMAEMDYAFEKEKNRKVDLVCKGTNLCVYSTFTNGNYNSFTFSQSTDFNTSELITLLNNFVKAYHKNSTSKNTEDEEYGRLQDDLDKYKSNIDIMNSGSNQKTNSSSNTSTTKTVSSQDYKDKAQKALQELNDYMVTLDNGRYKGMEVTNGYIIQNYEGGQSSKAKIEDIDRVEINTEYNYAKLACKGDSKCVYSSITGGYHDYFNFNVGSKSLSKMETLLKNFLTALKKCTENTISSTATNSTGVKTEAQKLREQKERERQSKTNNSNDEDDFFWMDGASDATAKVAPKTNATSSIKYETPLKNLNDYLKTFNPETYKDVEVKNGKVYFKFYVYGTVYNSYIDISALVNNTIVLKGKSVGAFGSEEIKIACKGESKCFYSEYSKGTADHFRFFSRSVADLSKMKQLVDDFIKSLPAK